MRDATWILLALAACGEARRQCVASDECGTGLSCVGGACVGADGSADAGSGVWIEPGDIVVVQGLDGTVHRCDPVEGERELIAEGGFLAKPRDVVVEPGGTLLIVDETAFDGEGAILRIDRSGMQEVVSRGQFFERPVALAIEADGKLVVSDQGDPETGTAKVIRVDPEQPEHDNQEIVASGEPMLSPHGLTIAADGAIVVADTNAFGVPNYNVPSIAGGAVFRIDPDTGAVEVISRGGYFFDPQDVAFDADGMILVIDGNGAWRVADPSGDGGYPGALLRVEYTTDDDPWEPQELVFYSTDLWGSGWMALEDDGSVILSDYSSFVHAKTNAEPGPIFRLSLADDELATVCAGVDGEFTQPEGIAIYRK